MATEQKSEMERGFEDLRREVVEARNLVIKTDNLLKNLHAEMKSLGKRQEEYEKRQWVSSGAAYLGFALLAIVAAVLVSSARVSSAMQEQRDLKGQVADLSGQLDKLHTEDAQKTVAAQSAQQVYKMMTNLPGDERLKGIDALMKLDTGRLSPLEKQALQDRAELLRKEIGANAYDAGKAAFRRNELTTATEQLGRYMAMNPPEHDALEASFFLGTAYNQLKKHDKAVPPLQRFVDGNRASKNRDYAMMLLAQSYEATGQLDKAASTARDALGTYPNSQYAGQLRNRLASVRRVMAATHTTAASGATPAAASASAAMVPGVSH